MSGGYDDGYRSCPCFWGQEPGSLVVRLLGMCPSVENWNVLDAGCGEGKNAVFLANRGAKVVAVDSSIAAIENGVRHWGNPDAVKWIVGSVQDLALVDGSFDLVIAYGLLHCLETPTAVEHQIQKFKRATIRHGYNIVCAFNSRRQDLSAHPGFHPTLLAHDRYLNAFSDWSIQYESDEDLWETHPHNGIRHVHALTRLIAKCP